MFIVGLFFVGKRMKTKFAIGVLPPITKNAMSKYGKWVPFSAARWPK